MSSLTGSGNSPIAVVRSQRIVTPAGMTAGEVTIQDGRISAVATGTTTPAVDAIELGEKWLVPGYIDMHVHGGGGAQCNTADPDEVAGVARFHAQHGTTGLLATTVAAPVEELTMAVGAIARCVEAVPIVLGAHLEGPFLSPARPGAMNPSTFIVPDPAILEQLLTASHGTVRMMTLAPELTGALELIRELKNNRVVASLGHSDASYSAASAAAAAGANAATHLFNGMRPFHHREPGIAALHRLPEVSYELICDGVHVDQVALKLVYRAKGERGVRLVTDAIEAAGMPDGRYRLGEAAVEVRDGVATLAGGESIAGSTLTMDVAVRNAVRFLNISVPEAVTLASVNPARLLGLADRKGAVAVGMDADLAVLDDDLLCVGTMVGGTWMYLPPSGA